MASVIVRLNRSSVKFLTSSGLRTPNRIHQRPPRLESHVFVFAGPPRLRFNCNPKAQSFLEGLRDGVDLASPKVDSKRQNKRGLDRR
jgi:hypothetical protein